MLFQQTGLVVSKDLTVVTLVQNALHNHKFAMTILIALMEVMRLLISVVSAKQRKYYHEP